ncbi:hypothetical protein BJ170DRAFT_684300 [Xylariales sp. AK1849]|nr:hypothetical protein BJ170DRAFT_684300 [Xylariales sp. AK1849]
MSSRQLNALALLACAFSLELATAQDPFTFCKDDTCGDCPVSVTSVGTGYPDCAIYNSADVFGNQGFPTTNNEISAFLNVPQQNEAAPCYLIFKSPANTEAPGCGVIQKFFQDATCGDITLDDTFMVQFCCGDGDCSAAGIPNLPGKRSVQSSAKFGRDTLENLLSASGGGIQSLRLAVNGTEIEPIYVGPPLVAESRTKTTAKKAILPRDGACDGNWVPLEGKEDYTRPADSPQIVSGVYAGETDVQITTTRTQEWSTTIEASLGFEDIVSLGISFSETFSESESNSEAATYHLDEGEKGYVIWTSFVRCSEGTGTCNGAQVTGEACTPYLDANSGKLAGEYSLVEEG